jgi:hypothetical protein
VLSNSKVQWVQQLLAQGLSYRHIREITGVGREAIGRIARGQRPDYEAIRRRGKEEQSAKKRNGAAARCPGCGYRVYFPCQICRIREAAARCTRRHLSADGNGDEPSGLRLRPEHQVRYEQVRARLLQRRCRRPYRRRRRLRRCAFRVDRTTSEAPGPRSLPNQDGPVTSVEDSARAARIG